MKKFTLLIFMTLLTITGAKAEQVLYNNSTGTADNIDNLTVSPKVKSGDVIRFTITGFVNAATNTSVVFKYWNGSTWVELTTAKYAYISAAGTYEYTITDADDISNMNSTSFSFIHNNATVTYLSIRHANPASSKITATADASTDGSQASADVSFSVFSDAKVGDYVRFNLIPNSSDYHQVWIKYLTGDGWSESATVLDITSTTSTTYDLEITETILGYLKGTTTVESEEGKALRFYAKNNNLTSLELLTLNTLTITDEADPACEEGTYAQVNLARTLVAGYNSLCLPFAVSTLTDIGLDASDKVYELSSDNTSAEYVKLDEVTSMSANTPYIVYCAADRTLTSAYTNLAVSTSDPLSVTQGNWTMYGNYTPNNSMEGKYIIYGDEVRLCGSGPYINGLRAYLVYNGGSARSSVRFSFDNITGIKEIGKGQLTNDNEIYYDLMGRRVNYPTKGLYIKNGKKVILK